MGKVPTQVYVGPVLIILSIILIAMSYVFPFHFFLPAWSHRDASFVIDPNQARYLECDLMQGGIVRGMIIISEGGNKDVDFYIEDSKGNTIVESKRVAIKYTFEFQSQSTGAYKFICDNKMSWFTQKSVYIIVWQYYYNFLFFYIGIGFLVIGAVVTFIQRKVLFGSMKKSTKNEKEQ